MHSPSNHYDILHRLQHTDDIDPQSPEKYLSMESQSPKDWFVVLNANKSIEWIFKHDIIPTNCKGEIKI